jgi:hypothetical protein
VFGTETFGDYCCCDFGDSCCWADCELFVYEPTEPNEYDPKELTLSLLFVNTAKGVPTLTIPSVFFILAINPFSVD